MSFDLKDPEVKAAFDAAVAEQIEAVKSGLETEKQKLKANNDKLLADLREARKSREINPEEHQKLVEQLEAVQAELDTERANVKKATADMTKQLETVTKQLASETAHTHKLLVETGLTDALVKAGVDAAYMPILKTHFATQAKVVADGDVRKAVIGDKALQDHILTDWVASDEAKHYIPAKKNGGGGSGGNVNHDSGAVKTIQYGDSKALAANLEAVAKGQVKIQTLD